MPLITLVLSATNDSPWSHCWRHGTGGCLKHLLTGRSRAFHFQSASLLPDLKSWLWTSPWRSGTSASMTWWCSGLLYDEHLVLSQAVKVYGVKLEYV